MRMIFTGVALAFCLPVSALAQSISNDMSCEQAVSYYEEHGRIDTKAEDQVLPIEEGVPASKRDDVTCDRGGPPEAVFVKTTDKDRCAVAYTCE